MIHHMCFSKTFPHDSQKIPCLFGPMDFWLKKAMIQGLPPQKNRFMLSCVTHYQTHACFEITPSLFASNFLKISMILRSDQQRCNFEGFPLSIYPSNPDKKPLSSKTRNIQFHDFIFFHFSFPQPTFWTPSIPSPSLVSAIALSEMATLVT